MDTSGLPARVISARIRPSPGVSISSASADTGSSPSASGSPRTRVCQRPIGEAPAAAGPADRVALAGGRAREHGAALAVEVAGQHVQHVHQPAGQRAELLRGGADPAVHGGPLGARQLARHAPDLLGADPARRRHRLGGEVARPAPAPRRGRRGARPARPGRPGPRRTACGPSPISRCASPPGRMKWCSSAASAVRVRRGSTTTTLPPRSRMRAQPPAHVGRGQQAAVGDQRVGAEDQQVVGAVDVGHRDRQRRCRTSGPTDTCLGIWSTVLAENTLRLASACRNTGP